MVNKKTLKIIAFAFIAAGIVVLVHQIYYWHDLFNLADFLHHENFIIVFFAIGITLLLVLPLITKKSKKSRA